MNRKQHLDKKWCVLVLLLFIIIVETIVSLNMKAQIAENDMLQVFNYKGNCIPDEETALQYGKILYRVRTGIIYDDSDFGVIYNDSLEAWNVWLLTEEEKNGETITWLDYHGVYIDKDYGTVIRDSIL